MEDKIFIDKNLFLDERVKELENSNQYTQYKVTYSPIPDDVLEKICDKAGRGEHIFWSDFIDKVMDYVSTHLEYAPVVTVAGENTSALDRAILLSIVVGSSQKELMRTLKEIGRNAEG